MKPNIVVVGSSNTDLVVKLPRLPGKGETVIGGTFSLAAGGKGANQAVAASRAGGSVAFVSKVGDDHFGRQALDAFKNDALDTRFVGVHTTTASGIALIFVDGHGENCIGVASGANSEFLPADVEKARELIISADVLLLQLEIPLSTVEATIRIASDAGVPVLLNPAPAFPLEPSLLRHVSIITPNESEVEILTGMRISDDATIVAASLILRNMGIPAVVITLGARGAYLSEESGDQFVAPFTVDPVDTTAAGDVFSGALAVSIGEGTALRDAVRFASAAAALSVTKLGAQPSAPQRAEIETLLNGTNSRSASYAG
ncbi:MAG: ribokinase [Ignavibacteriales bacterium]|nr:ribokinase [Ignavibacteriales bacterium]